MLANGKNISMKILAKPELKKVRKECGMTLADVAYIARMSEAQMSRIESQKRPIDDKQATRLLNYYGKSFGDLFLIEG